MRSNTALAAILLLASSTFMMRSVLDAPASLLQAASDGTPSLSKWETIGHADQEMVVALVVRNADLMTSNLGGLQGFGQCFPFPASYTLGEHGFAEGLLAAIPWVLTGEPILSYNFMLWIGYFLSGFSMFLLVRHFTGDARAGLLGGLFLQWVPGRIVDGGHPFLHAEFWLPLALLCLHRLFVTGRVRAAAGAAFFLGMQALGSFYLILGVIPVVLVYVPFLFWRHREHRWKALGLSLAAGSFVAVVGLWVLLPYLETREAWSVLGGRDSLLLPLEAFLPGQYSFPGWIFASLILLGIADRFRGPRSCDGEDPRLVMLLASGIILSCSTYGLRIPGTDIVVPSVLALLSGTVPGLDAVRALGVMSNILWVPLAWIAGYGARAVLENFSLRVQGALFVALALVVGAIRFWPPLAVANFGRPLAVESRNVRPSEEDIALVRSRRASALLHVPMAKRGPDLPTGTASAQLLLGSFSPSPTTSCYNSFASPFASQIGQLAQRLPRASSSEALSALGIDTVLFHRSETTVRHEQWFEDHFRESPEAAARVVSLGETETLSGYRLNGRLPTTSSSTVLHRGMAYEQLWKDPDSRTVSFWIRNRGREVYLEPEPRKLREGYIMWVDEAGAPVSRVPVMFLMPIALAPGERMALNIDVEPPPGDDVHLGYLSLRGGKWKGIALARVRRESESLPE